MNQNNLGQNQNIEPGIVAPIVKPERPILLTIIAILVLLASIVLLVMGYFVFFIGMSNSKGISILMKIGAVLFLMGTPLLGFVISIGLLKMQKWALYCFTIAGLIGALAPFIIRMYDSLDPLILAIGIAIIPVLIMIYLWSIHKKFS